MLVFMIRDSRGSVKLRLRPTSGLRRTPACRRRRAALGDARLSRLMKTSVGGVRAQCYNSSQDDLGRDRRQPVVPPLRAPDGQLVRPQPDPVLGRPPPHRTASASARDAGAPLQPMRAPCTIRTVAHWKRLRVARVCRPNLRPVHRQDPPQPRQIPDVRSRGGTTGAHRPRSRRDAPAAGTRYSVRCFGKFARRWVSIRNAMSSSSLFAVLRDENVPVAA